VNYIAKLYVCVTTCTNCQSLCRKCAPHTQTQWLRCRNATALVDSGINDWL